MKKSDLVHGEMYVLKLPILCRDPKYLSIFRGDVTAGNVVIFLDFYDTRQLTRAREGVNTQQYISTPFYQSPSMYGAFAYGERLHLAFASLLVNGQIIQAQPREGGLSNLNVSNHG